MKRRTPGTNDARPVANAVGLISDVLMAEQESDHTGSVHESNEYMRDTLVLRRTTSTHRPFRADEAQSNRSLPGGPESESTRSDRAPVRMLALLPARAFLDRKEIERAR